ncbi:MAG: dihydroorotate dehydrogenase electron transfer subunit, partial [Syntrophomonadaceae bacterium]|nr:dihydroorotate dehydrogenase electron transfer subunit [Syntrophomonadaceae bacterium]
MSTVEKGLVLSNRQLYKDMYEMEFEAANIASKCAPGQFVYIITGSGYDPLLRRPISLYDVNKDAGTISLLYKVVGKGTDLLSKVAAND